jgi:predicted alpha/beta hydrolase family esterase
MSQDEGAAVASGVFPTKAIIIPEMTLGAFAVKNFDRCPEERWYHDAAETIRDFGIPISLAAFPNVDQARADTWVPHLRTLNVDEKTLVIAHGVGAACLFRALSDDPEMRVGGVIVVAGSDSDLDDDNLRETGFFYAPLDFHAMRRQWSWVVAVGAEDDPYATFDVQLRTAELLGVELAVLSTGLHLESLDESRELLDFIGTVLHEHLGKPRGRPAKDGSVKGAKEPPVVASSQGNADDAGKSDADEPKDGYQCMPCVVM